MEGETFSPEPRPIQQASAIPYRHLNGQLEFCLITSSSGRRWGFPKGIIDPGMSPEETALQETYEEAGLRGRLVGERLGSYSYQKWGTSLDVAVYLLQVNEADGTWPEASVRERVWLNSDAALRRLDRAELCELFRVALDRLL